MPQLRLTNRLGSTWIVTDENGTKWGALHQNGDGTWKFELQDYRWKPCTTPEEALARMQAVVDVFEQVRQTEESLGDG